MSLSNRCIAIAVLAVGSVSCGAATDPRCGDFEPILADAFESTPEDYVLNGVPMYSDYRPGDRFTDGGRLAGDSTCESVWFDLVSPIGVPDGGPIESIVVLRFSSVRKLDSIRFRSFRSDYFSDLEVREYDTHREAISNGPHYTSTVASEHKIGCLFVSVYWEHKRIEPDGHETRDQFVRDLLADVTLQVCGD